MNSAAQLRSAVEASLAQRIPSALTPRVQQLRPVSRTGITSLDDLLGGGFPVGAISEIAGQEGSGHTTLALSFLARITAAGQVCAWIDVSDTLDPESAAAAGVSLDRLLWVRCGGAAPKQQSAAVSSPAAVSGSLLPTRSTQGGGGSPHPRNEVRGLDTAVEELMRRKQFVRDKRIGTPGMPNQPLAIERIEQVSSDRVPSRRGDHVLKHGERYAAACAEPQRNPRPELRQFRPGTGLQAAAKKSLQPQAPWSRLDQALRAADLLLQAGGFSAMVLDMAGIAPEHSTRVPLATWFRYRAAAERTRASLLLLTQQPCAKSASGVLLRLASPGESAGTEHVLNGLAASAELVRKRFETAESNVVPLKKQPRSTPAAQWHSHAVWAGGR
jgi:recombination protein RecA